MDLVSIIGTILAFLVIIVGTVLKGSTVGALWNAAAFVIVFAGTAAALLVQTQGKVLKHAVKMLSMVYRPPQHRRRLLRSRTFRLTSRPTVRPPAARCRRPAKPSNPSPWERLSTAPPATPSRSSPLRSPRVRTTGR